MFRHVDETKYKLFKEALADTVAPIAGQVKDLDNTMKQELRSIREELQRTASGTYSREMLDAKVTGLKDEDHALHGRIDDLTTDLKETKKQAGDEKSNLLIKVGVAVSLAYTLLQLIPLLAHAVPAR